MCVVEDALFGVSAFVFKGGEMGGLFCRCVVGVEVIEGLVQPWGVPGWMGGGVWFGD